MSLLHKPLRSLPTFLRTYISWHVSFNLLFFWEIRRSGSSHVHQSMGQEIFDPFRSHCFGYIEPSTSGAKYWLDPPSCHILLRVCINFHDLGDWPWETLSLIFTKCIKIQDVWRGVAIGLGMQHADPSTTKTTPLGGKNAKMPWRAWTCSHSHRTNT